jgi:antitoxin VapB
MAQRAKIFNNGGSQAVRLPKACRFPEGQREVLVRRIGKKVVLEPVEPPDEWTPEFLSSLGSVTEEIPRPPSTSIAKKKNPFG